MSDIEFKAFGGIDIDSKGQFDAHAAVFNNTDRDSDVIMPGAFTKTLSEQAQFPVLKMHRLDQVIGVTTPYADGKGLRSKGQISLDTQLGMETFKLMEMGAMTDWSIGYIAVKSSFDQRKGKNVRLLHELKLIENSILPKGFAANPEARTLQLKMWNSGNLMDEDYEKKIWEETENEIRFRKRAPGLFQDGSFARITLKKSRPRVFAIIGRLKGQDTTTIQALRFPKVDGWTIAKGKAWVSEHPVKMADAIVIEPGESHSIKSCEPDISTHEAEVVGLSQALSGFTFE
jgi:HK97 family phage prohead protease